MTSENFVYGETQYYYLVTSGDLRFVTDFVLKLDLNVAPSYCLLHMALGRLNEIMSIKHQTHCLIQNKISINVNDY